MQLCVALLRFNCNMKYCLTILLLLMIGSVNAQNLVPNHSFEDTLYTPNTNGIYPLMHWFGGAGSPNYFHPDNLFPPAVAPNTAFGYQEAKSGVAYTGVTVYGDWGTPNGWRECLTVKLLDTLDAGTQYCVSFYVSLAESSDYAISTFGVWFSHDTTWVDPANLLIDTIPQVANDLDSPINDKENWVKIEGDFVAQGGETFLSITSFENDSVTESTMQVVGDTTDDSFSYYFIDDVWVVEQGCVIDTQYAEIPNVFTPNNDGTNDRFELSIEGYETGVATIYNRWGQKIYEFNPLRGHWDGYTQAGVRVPEGVYFYTVSCSASDAEPLIKKGSVQLLR